MQSNTVEVDNQPINFASIPVENRTSDPFTLVDGRYVGHDGFVVPKNFDEFHERFPQYVRNWVSRHADRSAPREEVDDWAQDLLIHLRYLPATSKHREAGKQDIVQTFDPHKHHGANSARFFNYINLCLANKFRSMQSARMKNPLCRPGNLSLTAHWEGEDREQIGDEFCFAHSAYLRGRCQRQERKWDASHTLAEFAEFLRREDGSVLPVMGAIAATTTPAAAAELLGIAKPEFRRLCSRLRNLGRFFLNGEARLRRSTKPKPQNSHAYKIALCQPVQSSAAWNRVELYNEVWDQPLVKLSKKYGISDVRLGKVCRKLKIPHPPRGYWAKRAVDQTVGQVPLPEFKDAPVVKRLIRKSKPKIQRGGKIVPQKELCVNLCVNNFGKIGWESGFRVSEPVHEIGSTHCNQRRVLVAGGGFEPPTFGL